MRDRGPEAEQMAAAPDPLWEVLGQAAPRRAAPAFKARLRARLLDHPLPTAGEGGLGHQRRWLGGLGLLLVLALLFWPRAAEGPALPVPAAPSPTQPPTVAAEPRPAGGGQPLAAPTQTPATQASPTAALDRAPAGRRPAGGRPAPGPAMATAVPATAAAPAAGSDEDEPRPQVQPTLETTPTASATEALPDEPPTATAEPPANFPTRTPEAGTAGPPGP